MAPTTTSRRRIRLVPALLLPLLAACRGGLSADETVEFWALGREGEVVAQMLPEFARRHPEVHVRLQQIPWSAAHEKLLTAYVGESMPDLFQVGNTWVAEFVALDALEPLDERLGGSAAGAGGDYFAGILDTNVIDGATYALPWYVDTRLLFYRTDLLAAAGYAAPPRTWSGWVDALEQVKQRAAGGDFAMLLPVNEWQPLVILALQRGARLLRDGGRYGDFQSAAFRQAFAFYVDFFRGELAPLAGQAEVANLYQDFARGLFAAFVSGPWSIGELAARLPAALRDRWSTAPLPAADGPYPGASLAGGASLAMFRGSPRKDAAWRLLEFLSEPAQQRMLYRLTGDLPSRRSAWQSGGPAADPRAQAFAVQLENVVATPKIPEWERIAAQINRYGEAVVRRRLSIDEALAALDHDVDELLEKRRWMLRQRDRAAS